MDTYDIWLEKQCTGTARRPHNIGRCINRVPLRKAADRERSNSAATNSFFLGLQMRFRLSIEKRRSSASPVDNFRLLQLFRAAIPAPPRGVHTRAHTRTHEHGHTLTHRQTHKQRRSKLTRSAQRKRTPTLGDGRLPRILKIREEDYTRELAIRKGVVLHLFLGLFYFFFFFFASAFGGFVGARSGPESGACRSRHRGAYRAAHHAGDKAIE